MFFSFVDKPKSILCINEMFSKHEQSDLKKQLEPAKPVYEPWGAFDNNDDPSMWELNWYGHYSGPQGEQKRGPSNSMQNLHVL